MYIRVIRSQNTRVFDEKVIIMDVRHLLTNRMLEYRYKDSGFACPIAMIGR